MKNRDLYLNKLIASVGKDPIKIVRGMRRSGKSALFDLFERHLCESGVGRRSILRMDFESPQFDEIGDYMSLYQYVEGRLNQDGRNFILLDEVQRVSEWQKTVNLLRLIPGVDIYIAGSNARLLTTELSSLLSWRYVEIDVLPLSFSEYLDFQETPRSGELAEPFGRYLEYGGFPDVVPFARQPKTAEALLEGIYHTAMMKDVVLRSTVRDAALLDGLVRHMASNLGSPTSAKRVSDFFTEGGRKTNSETIDGYLEMLENAHILYRAGRYDLRGRVHLKTREKFYFADTGLCNVLSARKGDGYGRLLENAVYLELRRRGFEVAVGKLGTLEVDFVATRSEKRTYYQICPDLRDGEARERALKPLRGIPDNYGKTILTMDRSSEDDFEGIGVRYLPAFLLDDETAQRADT